MGEPPTLSLLPPKCGGRTDQFKGEPMIWPAPCVPWTDLAKLRSSVESAGAEFVVLDHLDRVTL